MAKILIVDRDRRAWSVYERELGRQRHRVTAVSSIHEGLRTYQAWKPDLVVLDIGTPDPWEVQAITSLLALDREMPVLFTSSLSGYAQHCGSPAGNGRTEHSDNHACMRQTIQDLLRPRRPDALGLRRRRVAVLGAPRPDGYRRAARHARTTPLALPASDTRALA